MAKLDGLGRFVRQLNGLRGKYAKQPKVTVGYATDYAVYVHENLEAYHPVGEAKFLEKPARQYRRQMGQQVRKAIRAGSTVQEAMVKAAEFLKEKSQALCPVDTGMLKDSAFVEAK